MATYKQYRAPKENDRALVDPGWASLRSRLAEPPIPAANLSFGGQGLEQLRTEARRGLIRAAIEYTGRYANPAAAPPSGDAPLIVSGHQPELFHPGVWFKNFVLDTLAKASGGVGVHLLIDSDLCRETSLRVPTGSVASPRVVSVAYDQPLNAMPHEQRRVVDAELLRTFADRAAETVRPLVAEPLLAELWQQVGEAGGSDLALGAILSAGRHRLERAWGSETLELPMSVVCDSEPFRRFAAELLVRSEQVAEAYNGALAEYRAAHQLKNAAQPLPDLSVEVPWSEMPLWVYSDRDPTRRPLFARHDQDNVVLTDHAGWTAHGPVAGEGLVEWLGGLRRSGIKIRSRALLTTLYGRLVLSDLFLHGIGGAKYDQVTDRFAERLLGEPPPAHATLTATLRLPIEHDSPTEADRQRLVRRRRELRYHPERFLPVDASPELRELAERKASWIAVTAADRRRERHEQITQANRQMYEALAGEEERTIAELEEAETGSRRRAILDSREYAFCLFPVDDVRHRLADLSRPDRD